MKFILTILIMLFAKVSPAQDFDHPWMLPVLDSLGNYYYIHKQDRDRFHWLSDESDLIYMYDDCERKIGYMRCVDGEIKEHIIPLSSPCKVSDDD